MVDMVDMARWHRALNAICKYGKIVLFLRTVVNTLQLTADVAFIVS